MYIMVLYDVLCIRPVCYMVVSRIHWFYMFDIVCIRPAHKEES